MAMILAIDLGTTNSRMSIIKDGNPLIIENSEGARSTPSVVGSNPQTDHIQAGATAKRQAVLNPLYTVYSAKRLLGRDFEESAVENYIKNVPFSIVPHVNGQAHIAMGGNTYSPPQLLAPVIQKLKRDAEARIGEPISQAVIAVPASSNELQRRATKEAARIAGLEVLRLINGTDAAALTYGDSSAKNYQTIAILDLGGGAFDCSILEIGDGVIRVLATAGATDLGGDDFDRRIIDWTGGSSGIDPREDPVVFQYIRESAERAKIELSTMTEAEIDLRTCLGGSSHSRQLVFSLSRLTFEDLASDLVDRVVEICKQAIASVYDYAGVDQVILVGGMTRMPMVREAVADLFRKEAYQGADREEAVVIGAALMGGILSNEVGDLVLLAATTSTLGIETQGGLSTTMIPRNTTIPTWGNSPFTTVEDNQTASAFCVVQGENTYSADNKVVERFFLEGIAPAPAGVPDIVISIGVYTDGELEVSAREEGNYGGLRLIPIETTNPTVSSLLAPVTGSDEEATIRMVAAEALGCLGDTHAVATLIDTLSDKDAAVRQRAAKALGRLRDARAVTPLIEAVNDPEWPVREAAAWALLRFDAERAFEVLLNFFRPRYGDQALTEALILALDDEAETFSRNCALLLAEMGDSSGVPMLISQIPGFDQLFGKRAALALARLGETSSEFLRWVGEGIDVETSQEVWETLEDRLGQLPISEIRLHTEFDNLVVEHSSILRGNVSNVGSGPAFGLKITLTVSGREIRVIPVLEAAILESGEAREWEIPFIPHTPGVVPYAWKVEYSDAAGSTESLITENITIGDRYGQGVVVMGDYVSGVKQGDDGIAMVRGMGIPTAEGTPVEAFRVGQSPKFCPHCGEELNLQARPRFCPFCGFGISD